MYGVSRIDYSRLRELRYPIYGVLIGSIVLVLGSRRATRGAKRWIELPFFNFQPSELGKVLLVLALGGLRRGPHALDGRQTTARVMLLGAESATMLVMLEPDIGSAIVYVPRRAGDPVRRRRPVATSPRSPRSSRSAPRWRWCAAGGRSRCSSPTR
jgi:rod shape determining protein RodA